MKLKSTGNKGKVKRGLNGKMQPRQIAKNLIHYSLLYETDFILINIKVFSKRLKKNGMNMKLPLKY